MKVLWLAVLCLATALALPTNRLKRGEGDHVVLIKRPKRDTVWSADNNGYGVSHSKTLLSDENFQLDGSISSSKRWENLDFLPDALSAQIGYLHKIHGFGVSIGANMGQASGYGVDVDGNYDVILTPDYGVALHGQYNWYHDLFKNSNSDYSASVNGRYRDWNLMLSNSAVALGLSKVMFGDKDNEVQLSADMSRSWQYPSFLPDRLSGRIDVIRKPNDVSAYVGIDHSPYSGTDLHTGFFYKIVHGKHYKVDLSAGYDVNMGGTNQDGVTFGITLKE